MSKLTDQEYKKLVDDIQLNLRGIIITEKDKIISLLEEFLSNCRKEEIDWKIISASLRECSDGINNWLNK